MNLTRLSWNPETDPDTMGHRTVFDAGPTAGQCCQGDEGPVHQPGFSIGIFWNRPKEWWKPFVMVNIWNRAFQIGWLFE